MMARILAHAYPHSMAQAYCGMRGPDHADPRPHLLLAMLDVEVRPVDEAEILDASFEHLTYGYGPIRMLEGCRVGSSRILLRCRSSVDDSNT